MSTYSRTNRPAAEEAPLTIDPRILAACIAVAGAAAAITLFVRKRRFPSRASVLSRCGKAVEKLERIVVCA